MTAVQLTKHTHACVALSVDDRTLVIDPGSFSPDAELASVLARASAVLVTHEHPDHLAAEALRSALASDEQLTLHAPGPVARQFSEFGARVASVEPGDCFAARGFNVQVYGGQHALIHPRIPVVANVGYLVEGAVFHPGDSFTVPDRLPSTLLAPVSAPWAKVAEVIDYVMAIRAAQAIGIHDAIYSDVGLAIVRQHVTRFAKEMGCAFSVLEPGSTVDV